jgi:single-strand DNA-binding protein
MFNRATIIGRLGRDPEIRYSGAGEAVCNVSVATTEKWKDKNSGEQKEATEWHRVTAWGRLAEIMGEYLHQGDLVFIEGKMTTREYQAQDGTPKKSFEIRATEMKMLGGRGQGEGGGDRAPAPRPPAARAPAPAPAPRQPAGASGFDDMSDDIPFVTASMRYDMEPSKARRMRSYDF